MRVVCTRVVWILSVIGCTPLGLWIYEDPVVTVARISFELRQSAPVQSPLVVALAVKNRNDYPLSAEQVELSLQLDGIPVGEIKRDSTVSLATDTVSTVALPLPMAKRANPGQLRSGIHTFAVQGRAIFRTPIGTRKVRFAQEGSMVFGQRPGRS
jgi:LEA14-like dessication related protein